MAQVKGKGQELSKLERRSTEFIEKLSEVECSKKDDGCLPLQASLNWRMLQAVNFRDGRNRGHVDSSFTPTYPVLRNKSEASAQSQMSPQAYGKDIHKRLSRFIKKRRGKTDSNLDEEKQVKELVENLEKHCQFSIIDSELTISGYANQQGLNKPHCWTGRIDAIGVKKDGTIIVVDWKVCCAHRTDEFWMSASEFSSKLHQTLIYREIIIAQWKDLYKHEKDVPTVGILIVPMASLEIRGSAPRHCLNFTQLRENGFFANIDKFTWMAQKPSKDVDRDSLQPEQEIDKVKTEDLGDTCFNQRQIQVKSMAEDDVTDLLTTLLFLIDVCWKLFCDRDKQNLSEVLQKLRPDSKYASLAMKYLPQLQSV